MQDDPGSLGSRRWFFRFDLPNGTVLEPDIPAEVEPIHGTRVQMMMDALRACYGADLSAVDALDMGCHQGFFSLHLAQQGCRRVLGLDARSEHIEDAQAIGSAFDQSNLEFEVCRVEDLVPEAYGTFDVVVMFGLLYHLANPIAALRAVRAVTRRICLIETQVVPGMSGVTDWGSSLYPRQIQGTFAIIDEVDETAEPEAGVDGISLCPSLDGLLWILRRIGFDRAEVLLPPADAYEQLRYGKRVMVAAYIE